MNLTKTQEYLGRLVNLHSEIETLNQDLKQIKEEIEEELPEVKWNDLNKVAKLKATQKLGETIVKYNEFVDLADSLHNWVN